MAEERLEGFSDFKEAKPDFKRGGDKRLGWLINFASEWAGHSRFIRVMPNTPAVVGVAASVISLGAAASKEDGDLIAKLFGAIGKVWPADEKLLDAVTGLRFHKDACGRIAEEVREIITLSSFANKLLNIQKQADEYARLKHWQHLHSG